MIISRILVVCAVVMSALPALAQEDDSPGPMQRKATEASADRLLDDSLLSDKEKQVRAQAKLAEPAPDTSDGDTLAQFHFGRGMALLTLGRQGDALRELKTAGHLVGPNGSLHTQVFYNTAQAEMNLGRVGAAIADLREATRTTGKDNLILRNLALITEQYAKLGNVDGATATREECVAASRKAALDRAERNYDYRVWRETNELRCDIAVVVAQGKLSEAEPLIRKVIAVYEDSPNTRGTYTVGNRHLQLAENLRQQGRLAEAENEARIALTIYQNTVGTASQRTGMGLLSLGRIIAEQGRLKEGEALARKGIEVTKTSSASGRGGAGTLADILVGQYRWKEAREQYALMKAGYEDDPDGWEAFIRQNPSYALAMLKSGDAAAALPLFTASFEDFRAKLGEDNYTTAQARGFRAAALAALGRDDEALREFALAVPVLTAGSGEEDEETGNRARDQKLRLILESDMEQLLKAKAPDAVAESFRLADAARGRSVQRALAASAVRAAAGNPALADLARRAQDSDKQIAALNGLLANAISARAEDQDAEALKALKGRIAALRDSRRDELRQIAAKFPEYGRMLNPQPVSVAEVQAKLKPGEAMVAFYSADDRTYAWAIPAAGPPAVAVSPVGSAALDATIHHLREALDLSVNGVDEIPDFDLAAAYGLYAGLMQPTEASWGQAGLLFVVPHGPLGQLPLALLPTTKPAPAQKAAAGKAAVPAGVLFAKYRDVAWLARKVAIAQLPSVGALTTLRALPERHAPRRTFLAFGDPLFNQEQAQEAATEATTLTSRGFKRRSAPKPSPDYSTDLAQLPRLPDTAEEVKSIAAVLKADPERDLFLEARASEANLNKLDLSQWRIVMFATHGLIPGDLTGLDQPALALTSPAVTGDGSSGLLTMEHIMGLKLDADWVVLSACNTAAGEGAGAEAVSGLGRAFFYAGTRALLVSNWPVETTSARMLTTDLFRRQAEDSGLARAKAMQSAMLALIDGPGPKDGAGKEAFVYAHPTFWAPFSLVGDGG